MKLRQNAWFLWTSSSGVLGLAALFGLISAPLSAQPSGKVELLKHPYPYKAALTILSDLHRTTVAEFEAVHQLINTTEATRAGSANWSILGLDRWAPTQGRTAIRGFGFPFADAFLFYDPEFGWFADYDQERQAFVEHPSGTLRGKFAEWYARGFIGPVHTFGTGDISSSKAAAAVDYLIATFPPHKRPRVWVNHSKAVTPAGVADKCCTLLNQILVDLRYRMLSALRMADRLSPPDPLPNGRKPFGYTILAAAVLFFAAGALAVFGRRSRHYRIATASMGLGIASLLALHFIAVDFYQGDNPGSRYFNLDQIRRLGVRYFWTVQSDYWQSTVSTIDLPEAEAPTGRPSIFRLHRFNDGSQGLMFLRNTINGGPRTMSLLTPPNLAQLIAKQGRSILYLHWLTDPTSYFGPEGIRGLEALASSEQQIWLTSAQELLDQAYAYSYVTYDVQQVQDKAAVNITGFMDPIAGPIPPDLNRLANLSFRCHGCASFSISLQGRPVPADALATARVGADLIATVMPPRN